MTATGERPVVLAVGLGPAGSEWTPPTAFDALRSAPVAFLRTARHPAADELLAEVRRGDVGDGVRIEALDELYDDAETLDDVYLAVVERLVAAAEHHGAAAYGVPGSPLVAERTVALLRADERVDLVVVPAPSFLDLAWVRVGVDPVAAGVRLIDAHRFEVEAAGQRGPLLVAQVDGPAAVEAVKLGISDALDRHDGLLEDPSVVVLHHLGLDDEAITSVPWHELDRVAVDHLTCAWIPHLAAPVAGEVQRFAEVVAHLRRTCPWDREQTHASLRRHLLEEAYEVLEAIDALDVEGGEGFAHLEEELGDLLFQVVFHSTLAAEEGQFTLADVARGIHDKLVLRHPHVFSDADAVEPDQVVANWEQIKKAEKARESVFDGIPDALPALLFAGKVVKKMATLGGSSLGDERPEGLPEVPGLTAAAAALADPAPDLSAMEAEEVVGAALLAVVARCAELGVEPENALRAAATATRDVARAAELRAPGTVPSE